MIPIELAHERWSLHGCNALEYMGTDTNDHRSQNAQRNMNQRLLLPNDPDTKT